MEYLPMKYFVMRCEGHPPAAYVKTDLDLPGGPWYRGAALSANVLAKIPSPIVYTRDRPNREGTYKDLYTSPAYPLMSKAFLRVLSGAGVDNIQVFPAIIQNELTGEVRSDYVAFNIVGLLAAADMKKSSVIRDPDEDVLGINFDQLVIDEQKAATIPIFRLAESRNAIVVANTIKMALEEAGIPGMVFYGPGEWSG
jgi:hypothetical protein